MFDVWTRRNLLRAGSGLAGLAVLQALSGCRSKQLNELPAPVRPEPEPVRPSTVTQPAPVTPTPQLVPPPRGPVAGMPQVLPRSTWTSRGVVAANGINPMNGVRRITIHHDGMDPFVSINPQDSIARLNSIRSAHLNRRPKPFADIGYHYVIDPAGRVWEARDIRYQGAHVQDNNENNLGIMVMGNFDQQRPTPAALSSLDRFVAAQMRTHRVPVNRVFTHREINPTACPGSNLQAYMVATRSNRGNLRLALADSDSALA